MSDADEVFNSSINIGKINGMNIDHQIKFDVIDKIVAITNRTHISTITSS